MKKVLVIALMLGAGLAYASTLGIPWFVDNSATGSAPPATTGVQGFIYLHNNNTAVVECTISYYTENGLYCGPTSANTFVIQPNASIAFRPVADDSSFETAGRAVPNRPRTTIPPGTTMCDTKKNGSAAISWLGASYFVQGTYVQDQCVTHATSATSTVQIYFLTGYGHLLPAGA